MLCWGQAGVWPALAINAAEAVATGDRTADSVLGAARRHAYVADAGESLAALAGTVALPVWLAADAIDANAVAAIAVAVAVITIAPAAARLPGAGAGRPGGACRVTALVVLRVADGVHDQASYSLADTVLALPAWSTRRTVALGLLDARAIGGLTDTGIADIALGAAVLH